MYAIRSYYDLLTIKTADDIQTELEMHDLFIVATARLFNVPVLKGRGRSW